MNESAKNSSNEEKTNDGAKSAEPVDAAKKIAELEAQVAGLQAEAVVTSSEHATELRAKDERITDLERQLRAAHQAHTIKVTALQGNINDTKNENKRLAAELEVAKQNAKFWQDQSNTLDAQREAEKKAKNAALIVAGISLVGNAIQASD
jgi:hypothetical protein